MILSLIKDFIAQRPLYPSPRDYARAGGAGCLPHHPQLRRVMGAPAAEVCGQKALCLTLKPLIAMRVQPGGSWPREFQHSGFAGRMVQLHGEENPQNRWRVARHAEADGIGGAFDGKPGTASIAEVALPQSFVIRSLSLVPGSRTAAAESVAQGQALAPKPQIGIMALVRNEIRATHRIISKGIAAAAGLRRVPLFYRPARRGDNSQQAQKLSQVSAANRMSFLLQVAQPDRLRGLSQKSSLAARNLGHPATQL